MLPAQRDAAAGAVGLPRIAERGAGRSDAERRHATARVAGGEAQRHGGLGGSAPAVVEQGIAQGGGGGVHAEAEHRRPAATFCAITRLHAPLVQPIGEVVVLPCGGIDPAGLGDARAIAEEFRSVITGGTGAIVGVAGVLPRKTHTALGCDQAVRGGGQGGPVGRGIDAEGAFYPATAHSPIARLHAPRVTAGGEHTDIPRGIGGPPQFLDLGAIAEEFRSVITGGTRTIVRVARIRPLEGHGCRTGQELIGRRFGQGGDVGRLVGRGWWWWGWWWGGGIWTQIICHVIRWIERIRHKLPV